VKKISQNLLGNGLKVGIVLSRFNQEVGQGLLLACESKLLALGVLKDDITLATVPGALEIPVALQAMANSEQFDTLIALGAIIRGETYHFEIVANESARGVSDVQIQFGIPVANAILTTENDEQAIARMQVKGAEAAEVAIEMANLLKDL
jgi:6,7-dimethyl-8-ribityllumazine synthase